MSLMSCGDSHLGQASGLRTILYDNYNQQAGGLPPPRWIH